MQARGETVAFLGLIDAFNFRGAKAQSMRLWLRFKLRWQDCVARPFHKRIVFLADWVRVAACQSLVDMCVHRGWHIPGFLRDPAYATTHARMSYSPGPYNGAAALFCSQTPSPRMPHMGWADVVAGGLEVYQRAPGYRGVFPEPSVKELGMQLNDSLRRIQAPLIQNQNFARM